ITKRDDERVLVYASKLSQPQAAAGVKLRFYPQEGEARQAETDAEGIGELSLKDWSDAEGGGILVVAVSGDSLAYSYAAVPGGNDEDAGAEGEGEGEGEGEAAPAKDHLRPQVFLFTERPLYRPAQKVYFKGILRLQDPAGNYRTPPPGNVEVSIQDPKGNPLWDGQLQSNANGSFWGDYDLPEEADLGYYQLKVTFHGKEFSHTFDVDEYRKPEFKVEVRPDKPRYYAGDKLRFLIDTQYYFGAPVEADISYTLYKSAFYYSPPGEDLLPDV